MSAITRTTVFAIVVGAFVSAVYAQKPDLTGVSINTYHVADNIYMLEATGDVAGNIAVSIGDDGVLIVDDQWAELTPQISAAIAKLSKGELRFILNTHHHDDHADGNANLAKPTSALIVAHDDARKRIKSEGRDKAHWPIITFSDGMSFHFNGDEVRARAFPGGHTDNDIVVFFENANVIHMGDLFNSGISSFPIADIKAGGSAMRMLENVKEIMPLIPEEAKIIPGHGPLSDKAGLRSLYKMLQDTVPLVRKKKLAGQSLDEIIAEGLPSEYDAWGYGYTSAEQWIEIIYNSGD